VRSGSIVVHYVADCATPQAAVIVGKGSGGAVQRHRRQRQVRHALVAVWDRLPAGSYVVRALPADVAYPELARQVEGAVARL
jgi:ribonuclease P protein component